MTRFNIYTPYFELIKAFSDHILAINWLYIVDLILLSWKPGIVLWWCSDSGVRGILLSPDCDSPEFGELLPLSRVWKEKILPLSQIENDMCFHIGGTHDLGENLLLNKTGKCYLIKVWWLHSWYRCSTSLVQVENMKLNLWGWYNLY